MVHIRDQMHTLFSFLGKIEDLRLYPSLRSAPQFSLLSNNFKTKTSFDIFFSGMLQYQSNRDAAT